MPPPGPPEQRSLGPWRIPRFPLPPGTPGRTAKPPCPPPPRKRPSTGRRFPPESGSGWSVSPVLPGRCRCYPAGCCRRRRTGSPAAGPGCPAREPPGAPAAGKRLAPPGIWLFGPPNPTGRRKPPEPLRWRLRPPAGTWSSRWWCHRRRIPESPGPRTPVRCGRRLPTHRRRLPGCWRFPGRNTRPGLHSGAVLPAANTGQRRPNPDYFLPGCPGPSSRRPLLPGRHRRCR